MAQAQPEPPKQGGFGAFKMAEALKPADGGAFGAFKMTAAPPVKDDNLKTPVTQNQGAFGSF